MSRKSNPAIVALLLICLLGSVAEYLYYGVEIYIPPSKTDETWKMAIDKSPSLPRRGWGRWG